MTREEYVLAGLAPAKGSPHTPVQVQKLFFILDENIADLTCGPHFHFTPYDYGPFDSNVYRVLERLAEDSKVELIKGRWTEYRLTADGQKLGDESLSRLDTKAKDYIAKISALVRALSFTQLVTAIYKKYPKMAVNSVFQE